jgi:hypothetical protein
MLQTRFTLALLDRTRDGTVNLTLLLAHSGV